MDSLISLVVPTSATVDMVFIFQCLCRFMILNLAIEMFGVVCSHLGSVGK